MSDGATVERQAAGDDASGVAAGVTEIQVGEHGAFRVDGPDGSGVMLDSRKPISDPEFREYYRELGKLLRPVA